jgi:phenylacetate-CoA ligase
VTIWDEEHECMDRERLEELQLERLRGMTSWVAERVPFYRRRLGDAGFEPGDLTGLGVLSELPFTEKTHFREEYPTGLFAVPREEVVELHSSSGTTGKPVVAGFTAGDLDTWAELVCRMAVAVGVGSGDTAQVTLGYGMSPGGHGLQYGLQRAGAEVIPVSAGNTERQIQLMQDLGSTVLVATPTYALHLGDMVRESAVPVDGLSLRVGMFGAEACSEQMRQHIEAMLPLVATDNYGLTEIAGPGVAGECLCRTGMHVAEDHYIVECVDPATGRPLPDGELGELVFTTLTREASPVLRYRTRDLSTVTRETCACGRTTARIGKIVGRTDEMFVVNGVNVFPSAVETVLFAVPGVKPFYRIVLRTEAGLDRFEVQVEVQESVFSAPADEREAYAQRLAQALHAALLVTPLVTLVGPGGIERVEVGKTRRVFDERGD